MDMITIPRKTKETDITVSFALHGTGDTDVCTGVGFLDHMLTLFGRHGFFTLLVKASGDTEVDFHHTVEDVGITLGMAFKKALGSCEGIRRYGFSAVPMDEALAEAVVDIAGRSNLVLNADLPAGKVGEFDTELVEAFFKGFVDHAFVTLHLNLRYGRNAHHCIEALFKACAKALAQAVESEPRYGVPSTKGVL